MIFRLHSTRHPARVPSLTARAAALVLIGLAAAGCETTSVGGLATVSGETRAERLALAGDAGEAAAVYIGLASSSAGAERDRLTLLAAEQWLIAGDRNRAASAFAEVAQPPQAENAALERSVRARFLLVDGDPEQALTLLERLSAEPLPTSRRLAAEALRARTYIALEQPARGIEVMRQREAWLRDDRDIARNREQLWDALSQSSPTVLRESAADVLDPEVRGWLSLAALASATGKQGVGWSNGAFRWRERNPAHPAVELLDGLPEVNETLLAYPRQIGLLLPLSGRDARVGKAVQNGFFGAYFANAGGLDDRQGIRIYDVNAEGGAAAAYDSAVADGAEFVVGPLRRSDVAELANNSLVPVPVLTLNYLNDQSVAPPGLFQFALAPEDEAVAAAERAIADGHTRAVALVPNNNWGRRLLTSFSTAFETLGGQVLDTRTYASGNPDFSGAIEDLMALSGSVRRYQRLRANIGGPLQFDPRRRQDVQFVFLAADAATGRLIKSQLKFHYSGELPVYATSLIYAQDGRSDSDLNGVRFADAPWLIAPQSWIAHLPAAFTEYFPEEKRLARLHAMGFDAYQLIGSLYAYQSSFDTRLEGASGELYLDADGRVHRRLAWAEFQNDLPGVTLRGQQLQ
ncbi:MAG: penicillin-binding protein activator [Pseudomonadota bacterium]